MKVRGVLVDVEGLDALDFSLAVKVSFAAPGIKIDSISSYNTSKKVRC